MFAISASTPSFPAVDKICLRTKLSYYLYNLFKLSLFALQICQLETARTGHGKRNLFCSTFQSISCRIKVISLLICVLMRL